jgi:hypothetical protein
LRHSVNLGANRDGIQRQPDDRLDLEDDGVEAGRFDLGDERGDLFGRVDPVQVRGRVNPQNAP